MKFDPFGRLGGQRREDEERKLIVFEVAGIRCALDIMTVKEIINPGPLVPVPEAREFILGAADHRSTMVPVIDMRRRLGLPAWESPRAKWVIALVGGKDAAFVVDVVKGVASFRKEEQRERHPLMSGSDLSWVKTVFGGEAGLTFELDAEAMLGGGAAPERRARP
jgi:purine-binding chemotaxis protein CheW